MEKEGTFYFELTTSLNSQLSTFNYSIVPEDVEILTEDMPGWLVANNGILTIALDIELTDELIEEGIARELINRIQNLRKSSGLDITDRIAIVLEDRPEIHNAVLHCGDYIKSQVLATSLTLTSNSESGLTGETCLTAESGLTSMLDMDGYNVKINIKKS
jgi:isoleucyl-tRNA synthetase